MHVLQSARVTFFLTCPNRLNFISRDLTRSPTQMITRAIGPDILYDKLCRSVSKKNGRRERGRECECKVALFFVLAVARREIVLHARIASKRRRLHRSEGGKKKEAKKEGKKENGAEEENGERWKRGPYTSSARRSAEEWARP